MAALTVCHCCCSKRVLVHHEFSNRKRGMIIVKLSCEGRRPDPEEKKEVKLLKWKVLKDVIEKGGKRVKEILSPQQKGDWKDLLLVSISFAVYVYISQMLVCAYCAWTTTSVPKPIW